VRGDVTGRRPLRIHAHGRTRRPEHTTVETRKGPDPDGSAPSAQDYFFLPADGFAFAGLSFGSPGRQSALILARLVMPLLAESSFSMAA
jgi:hypothetical protein